MIFRIFYVIALEKFSNKNAKNPKPTSNVKSRDLQKLPETIKKKGGCFNSRIHSPFYPREAS